MENILSNEQHNVEIHENLRSWQKKPVLQKIYHEFYKLIASNINYDIDGKIVELGSGIGNLKMLVPEVVCTDIFPNPWIDQVENAYALSFENESVSNIILFDVWHHLKYPGDALKEFKRVLKPGGRVIIFDPAMSILGFLVYGAFHHEPVAYFDKITWQTNNGADLLKSEYYAAQGNASRIFYSSKYNKLLGDWEIKKVKKYAALSYVLSGGYGKKQLYPYRLLPAFLQLDKFCNYIPSIFATRLLVVLTKN
jgi:SAM-dependent methyltransferase